jgi:hypothetical protein
MEIVLALLYAALCLGVVDTGIAAVLGAETPAVIGEVLVVGALVIVVAVVVVGHAFFPFAVDEGEVSAGGVGVV